MRASKRDFFESCAALISALKEHLGLISPQVCKRDEDVTPFMRPAPIANEDETGNEYDDLVADPLADNTIGLWNDTARRNREIFTEIFRPIPTNLVRDWNAYSVGRFVR